MNMDKAPAYGGRVSRKLRRSIFFQHFAGELPGSDGGFEIAKPPLLTMHSWVEGLGYYPVR